MKSRPIEGIDDAQQLGTGVAVLGGDTLVAVLADDEEQSNALLRQRLEATGDGPELPELGDDLVAARLTPAVLGAWLDREELRARSRATRAGRCAVRTCG